MQYYIENLIEASTDYESQINPNLKIRAATLQERHIIKSLISGLGLSQALEAASVGFHENSAIKWLPDGGVKLTKRPESDFRYFILEEIDNAEIDSHIYAQALLLTDKEFFIPFGFSNMENKNILGGITINYSFESEQIAYTYFKDKIIAINKRKLEFPEKLTYEDKNEILDNLNLLNDFNKIKHHYPEIQKALNDYFKLFEMSNHSDFKIIPYFTNLEKLIVESTVDKKESIKLGLESKLNLINNRIDNPIIISDYFKGQTLLTVGKLFGIAYQFKSSMAHGDFSGFEKSLKIHGINSTIDILRIIRKVLKNTIKFAIKEPQLISDLKKC